MKNFINYLSKKSLSLENGSVMTRKRLGNGSGMTRFSLASLICLCMLTIGVGNVWGTTVSVVAGTYNKQANVEVTGNGSYIFMFGTSSDAYVMQNATSGSNYLGRSSQFTSLPSSITITTSPATNTSYFWSVTDYDSKTSTFKLCGPNGYCYCSASGKLKADQDNSSTWHIGTTSGVIYMIDGNSCYVKNTGASGFRAYSTTGNRTQLVAVYKLAPSCTPLTMSSVTAEPGNGSISLSWSAVDHADSYTVTCKNKSTGVAAGTGTGSKTGTSCTITGLTNGTEYTWSVTPVGSGTYCADNDPETGDATPNATYTINYYDATGAHSTTATEGQTLKSVLPASPTSCDAVNYPYFVGWKSGSIPSETTTKPTVLTTEVANSTTAANTYYAVWSDVSPINYATTYTSNVTLPTSGTYAYEASVEISSTNYDAAKIGKSGNGGSSTFSIPSGTTTIYLHAYSWYNEDNTITLSVPSGVTISPSTAVSLPRNSSFSGSSNDYTLSTPDGTQLKEFTLTGVDAAKTVTIASTGRTLVFGINAVASGGGGGGTAHYITSCCNQLAAPANPGETPNSTGAVLTWDEVTDATGYEVKIDGGEWTSTGNGTTTGYTITGKACGGTSVSWQVRAIGDGSTNCAKGAATTARNFTTTACACTNQYTYFWGTQITNDNPSSSAYASHHFECFNTWNSTEGKTGLITLPNSDTENYWFVGYNGYYYNSNLPGGGRSWCTAIYDMNYANSQSDGKVLGWNSTAYPRGATGYIRIYSDNTNSNKYAAFIPSGYILRWKNNRNSDAWTSYPFTDTGASNYWETDLVQLGADLSSDKVWVGLPTSGMSESFTWCGKSEEKNLIGVGKKTGASTWAANGIVAGDANQWGKWRIEVTNNATNWNVHFVPYWKATYDVNGGGAISPTTANEGPVSCEGDATVRQVTMPAAPTYAHHDFGGWKSSADNSINAAGATVSLTQNTTFTAQWTNSQYNITATLTNVTSETSFPVAYTYTGSAANVTYTFEASSGYRLPDNVTVTGSTYSWNKNSGELTLTGTITGAVSITISGTQTHTVTWSVNGATASSVTYDHGAALVLPTPDPSAPSGCSSKTFIGWTTHAEISSEVHDKPTLLNPASPGTVAGDVTYRAVFADEVTGKTTVTRYLYTTSISTGKNYIIASSNSAGSVNTATYPGSGNAFTNTSMTVVSGTPNYIAAPANNNAVWSVATGSASGKYYIQNVGTSGNYIRINGSAANISTDATDVYFDSDHGVFGKSGSGSTSYSFYYSSGWTKGTFSTSNRNYIFEATEVEVETTTTDNYITLCSTCTTPSNVTASSISSTGATISWEGVSIEPQPGGSGTGFVVKYGTNATRDLNSNTVNATSSESSKALTGLTPATQYYAWVQAKCDNSWSETPASFHTAAKITYDKNGGTGTNTSEDVTYNSNVTIKTIATLGFEAPSGKTFNGWLSSSAVTVGGSSTTSVADGATISNLTVAITLTAQWRDLASYTVHYSANNGTIAGGADQIVYENGTLTFPNVTPTCGAFVGWIESSSYSSGTKPSGATFHLAGDEIAVTDALDGKTYYAVYAEETAPEPTEDYVLIENEQADWSGDYLIVVSYDDSGTPRNRAMDGSLATLDASSNYQDVTITSKTITSNGTTDGYKFTIAKVVGQPGKYSILSAHGEYMGSDASNTASKPNEIDQNATLSAALYNTISYNSSENRPEILGSNANPLVLTFNKTSGQTRFRYMTAVSTAIQLYKKGGGSVYTYKTSPSCSPTVATSTPASSFTYVYGNGPSASQTFQVSGSNLSANLTVAAPSNYQVSTDNSTFSNSVNVAPTDGKVTSTTIYIRLVENLNVGTYSGGVITVSSTGADNEVSGALIGSVTKAAGAIAFTDFNAVDHYEAEMAAGASSVDVTLTVSVTGDGAVSFSRSPAGGSSAVPATTPTTTLHVTTVGTWTVTANLAAGTNYTSASTNCQVVVYYADRFYDNLHGNSTIVKRNDVGEDHYTIPSLSDESRLTSGSCSETHYHFMGWVPEAALGSLTDDASYTAVMITSGTQAASGTNYYAVWAEE